MRWRQVLNWSALRRIARNAVLRAAAGIVVLLGLLWLVVVTGTGMSLVVPAALGWAAPPGWTVEVGSVEGAWHTRISLRNVEVRGPGASATVEELVARFRVAPLLLRRIEVRSVLVLHPTMRVLATTGVDGEAPTHGDSKEPATTRAESPPEGLLGAWTLDVASIEVIRGAASVERDDVTYAVSEARLTASAQIGASGVRAHVDSLIAEVTAPAPATGDRVASPRAESGRLVLSGGLAGGRLDLDTLSFDTPRSSVDGSGMLLLTPSSGSVDSMDFELVAAPLDLRDLPLSLPGAPFHGPDVNVRIMAGGAADSMVVRALADGPAGTSVDARAILRAPSDVSAEEHRARDRRNHAPRLEVTADVSGDLAPWSRGPLDGYATAHVVLRLDELDLRGPGVVEATLVHRAAADTVGALLGDDLRMEIDLERRASSSASAARGGYATEAADSAGPVEASVTIYRAVRGSADWSSVGSLGLVATERRADWDVDLDIDSGSLAGRGSAAWGGEPPELVIERLDLRDFDASALSDELPTTDVTAYLEGRAAGNAIDELDGTLAVQLGPSTLVGRTLRAASLRARLEPGTIRGALVAHAARREVSTDFEVALGDSTVSATASRLRLSVPADTSRSEANGVLVADTPSDVEVRGRASGTWWLTDRRRATVSLSLDSARLSGLEIGEGTVEGRLVDDSVTALATVQVERLLSGPASVEASLAMRGTHLADLVGRLELSAERTADASESAPGALGSASDRFTLTVSADEPGRFFVDGSLQPARGGDVDIEGRADVGPTTMAFEARVAGSLDAPTELLGQATIDTLLVTASGERRDSVWRALQSDVSVRSIGWRGLTAQDVRLVVRGDSIGLRLDTLDVQSDVLTLAGAGSLPRSGGPPGRIDLRGSFDLEALRDVVEAEIPRVGENAFVVTVSGTTDAIEASSALEVEALSYGDIEIAGVGAELEAVVEPPFRESLGISSARVDLELDAIALPESDVQNLAASLTGSPDSLRLEISALVDEERTGELVATIDPRPDARVARLESFELQLDEDRWALAEPARISYADGYSLRSFHLVAGDQAILLDGSVRENGALDLSLDMDSTDVGTVSDLLGLPRLDGWLAGTVDLEGTLDAPVGTADLWMGYHEEGRPPTTARILLEASGPRMTLDADLKGPRGGLLAVEGSLPLPGQTGPPPDPRPAPPQAGAQASGTPSGLALRVEARAFDVSSAAAFVDSALLATLDGRVDADLTLEGPWEAPRLEGTLGLTGGRARLSGLGVTWENIALHARGDGGRLAVDSARVESGGGHLTLSGSAALEDVGLDLDARLEDFQAIQSAAYQAVVSGDLHLEGTPLRPVLEGDVQVESLDVYLGEGTSTADVMDVQLSDEDFQILRERFGYSLPSEAESAAFGDLLTADLTVELSRDSWLRKRGSPEMAVAFTGEVAVQLRPQAEPRLEGTLTTIAERGSIRQFGKRFEPREGTVTLAGPPDSARVDLAAVYQIPSYSDPDNAEATIVLSVEGMQDDLSLTLSSEPPMETADIVSYIATGRPAGGSLALDDAGADGGGDGLAATGAGVALGQLLGPIERAAQQEAGLDVVEIRRDRIRAATLIAGKYLTPRLYAGIAQPITREEGDGLSQDDDFGSAVEIEYEAIRGLLLNLEGSDSGFRVFLRGQIAY